MTDRRGFTLLEVLIVLLIVGGIAGFAINKISNTYRMEGKALAWRMSSTIKYLYNTAVTENKTVRLAFDFESGSYWAEATGERFLMENKEGLKPETEKKEEEEEEEDLIQPLKPTFGTMESPLLEVRQFPKSVMLKDVRTGHDAEPVISGRAYIYFFPNGYAEPAVINFRNETDEKHISIKINPFNGDVDVGQEYRKLEDES